MVRLVDTNVKEYVIYSYSSNDYYYVLYDDQLVKFSNDGPIFETFPLKEDSKSQNNEQNTK